MNFLAHYYFDHQEGRPEYNLGLIFPDIVRNFVPRTKLSLTIDIPKQNKEYDILQGCIQHVESDKVFHAWQGFHDLMDIVTQKIRASKYPIGRDWFVSHILVELTMDYYLLQKQSNLATMLYTDFAMVDTKVIDSFLAHHQFSKFEQFHSGYAHFMKLRYLESYAESDNIVYALGKICTKMKLEPFSEQQKALLQSIIEEISEVLHPYMEALDVELK